MTRFSEAFIFLAGGAAEPQVRQGELSRTAFVPVEGIESAVATAVQLQAGGLDLVELYAGLGPTAAAAVFDAIGGEAPVGMVGVEESSPCASARSSSRPSAPTPAASATSSSTRAAA